MFVAIGDIAPTELVQCQETIPVQLGQRLAIILTEGAAASETLIGGYICTIRGCSTPPKTV